MSETGNLAVLKIGPYFYRVKPMPESITNDLEGMTDKKRTTIYLDVSLPHERREVTYWHEVLHALFDLVAVSLPDEVEERLVDSLAPALVQLLDDNQHVRWGWMEDRPNVGFEPDWDEGPYEGGSWVPPDDDGGGGRPPRLVVIPGGKGSV